MLSLAPWHSDPEPAGTQHRQIVTDGASPVEFDIEIQDTFAIVDIEITVIQLKGQ
jgi:hypothetical protein